MMTCSGEKCPKKQGVAWTVDGKPFCNGCYLNWLDSGEWNRQRITRLSENEELYVDLRIQKRARRTRQPNPCGAPMQLRA